MDMEYEIVKEFDTNGKHMVTVMINGNAHVMEIDEWRVIWGRNHMDRWLNPHKCKYRVNTKYKMAV